MRKAKRAKSKLKLRVFICAKFQLKADKARKEPAKSPHCCVATSQQVVLLGSHCCSGCLRVLLKTVDSSTRVALNLTFAGLSLDVSTLRVKVAN